MRYFYNVFEISQPIKFAYIPSNICVTSIIIQDTIYAYLTGRKLNFKICCFISIIRLTCGYISL